MTQMLAQREHDYFAETVICANCFLAYYVIRCEDFFVTSRRKREFLFL